MRVGKRVGAGVAALGTLVAAGSFFIAPAHADLLVPSGGDFYPSSSSVIGGQVMELDGENLYGLQKITFGDTQAQIFYADTVVYTEDPDNPYEWEDPNGFSFVLLRVPAHPAGTVPITAYLDPTKADIPLWGTVVESAVTTSVVNSTDLTTVVDGTDGPVTSTIPTESTLFATDVVDVTEPVTNSLDTSGLVDGLIPVVLGEFTYLDAWSDPLTPNVGPAAGGTDVTISGPFVEDGTFADCEGQYWDSAVGGPGAIADLARADVAPRRIGERHPLRAGGKVGSADASTVEPSATPTGDPDEGFEFETDFDVYFGDVRATDARVIWRDDEPLPIIRVHTPAHAAGEVDVTVVFHDAACEPYVPTGKVSAAAVPHSDKDLVVTKAKGFTYREAAVATTAPVETTSSVVVSSGVAAEPSTPTTTSTGPVLAATGVRADTLPMLVAGLGLLLAGLVVMAWSRPVRREH